MYIHVLSVVSGSLSLSYFMHLYGCVHYDLCRSISVAAKIDTVHQPREKGR